MTKRRRRTAAEIVFAEIVAELTPERCDELRALGIDPDTYAFEELPRRMMARYEDHVAAQQRKGDRGGRARIAPEDEKLATVAATTGPERQQLAAKLADEFGIRPASILRRARRLRAK